MNSFLFAVLSLGGLGLFFGAGLAYASKIFTVDKDPKIDKILNALPGINCGSCGYPGCQSLAEAIVSGEVPVNKCTPGGAATAQKIAKLLGVA
ncbi:MAG: RnfABCDGE type electron transport complex subunit B, partial [Candidatus Theseobacter exili]|nr:RnfABCDGE type electron transport complex subunit B [Candidatus Theseobacter exili]